MKSPSEMRRLLTEYRVERNRKLWSGTNVSFAEMEDTLIRVTGLAALARLEKPTGNDADDWGELRELTYATLLRFVSVIESSEEECVQQRGSA